MRVCAQRPSSRLGAIAKKGAVAAGHRLTAQAAADILRQGGNAFDAAIAAAWMACVCEPVLASPGGGGFAMVRTAGGTTLLHDFFAHTPLHQKPSAEFLEIHADFGETTQAFHIGKGSTATPGFVPGLFHLHQQLATVPMAELITGAVRAALDGVTVSDYQHYLSTVVSPILLANQESARVFAPDGQLTPAGGLFRNPGLAGFFELLAAHGLTAYDDEICPRMVTAQHGGGHLTIEDFEAYEIAERSPLQVVFGELDISLNPAPSAGGVLIAHTLSAMTELSPLELARALDETDRQRRACSGDLAEFMATLGPPGYRGTTHISVIDAAGDACALTVSNGEGNGRIVSDCGFMLNNMLGEADVNPHGAAGWPENCRLSSMMCPSIVHTADGMLMALGSGGSNRIRSAIATVLCALADQPHAIEAAIQAPRMHIEAGHLDIEAQFGPDTIGHLKDLFETQRVWRQPNMFFGGCHIVAQHPDGHLTGVGDQRRSGVCITV